MLFRSREVPRIELATGVVPTYSRHPLTMAQQALTVAAASDGRFVLGIGLSHQFVIEHMFGLSFEKPVRHMREYLSVLVPLLEQGAVSYSGETIRTEAAIGVDPRPACPVLVAALGTQMLNLAGSLTQGTVTWMTGPRTLGDHTAPTINAAAERAGVEITAVADTHIHNDYVSGALGLARRHGADYLLSAGEHVDFERVGVRDGDVVPVGALEVEVIATPGHTRHHQSFLVRPQQPGPGDAPGALLSGGSLLQGTVEIGRAHV